MKTLFWAPIILVLLAWTASVSANVAIMNFVGDSSATVRDSVMCGWEFTVTQEITITHLGLYDDGNNGIQRHPIGLWEVSNVDVTDGTLLTSGELSYQNNPLIDGFRYDDVDDVVLTTGQTYVVAFYEGYDSSGDKIFTTVSSITIDPAISIRTDATRGEFDVYSVSAGLPFPSEYISTNGGYRIGPNFLFETSASEIPSGGQIPEPASMVLVSIGLMTSLVKFRKSGNR